MIRSQESMPHPRDEIMRTMERIYRFRMTTTSGGNLSLRDKEGNIWITPARVDKGSLRRDDIVCVRTDGSVEGRHKPSSEFPFHRAVYEARPDIRGIVHAHPVALVSFSMVSQAPDTRLFHQARQVCGEAGFAPYALPGSDALAKNVACTFAKGFHCIILENHGVVVGGGNLQEAFQRFETLEFTAKTIIKASLLEKPRYLNDEQLTLPRSRNLDLPEFEPEAASTLENELRQRLCDFARRGYQQRLLISTQGSFSARLDGESFLVTPYNVDRNALALEDIVRVRAGEREAGKWPSRAVRNHQAIYEQHPGVGAVVFAYPVNATAFGVTGATLDSRTIPESYIFLRDVQRVPFGVQFRDSEELARRISMDQPVALLENDGVAVVGANVLDAFDRLEVLESTAEALINSRPLDEVKPMSDEVIEELKAAFFKK